MRRKKTEDFPPEEPAGTKQGFPFHVLGAAPVDANKHDGLYFERKNYKICTIEYVCSGKGFLEIGGKSYTAPPGSLFILHKGSNHRYWTERGPDTWIKLCWEIDGDMVEALFRAYGLQELCFMEDAQKLKPIMEELIKMNLNEQLVDQKAAVIFHRLVYTLFLEHHRRTVTDRIPRVVQQLMTYITNHVNEKIDLQAFAESAGLSMSYLIRSFRAAYQASPLQYHLRLKYESALRMLGHHAKTIKEISEELGFADQFYFSRFFRKINGNSPLGYRREISRKELEEETMVLPLPPMELNRKKAKEGSKKKPLRRSRRKKAGKKRAAE